ncbi:hypothetical protein EVJ58_g4732 [Rhodofomes roseus]|uniref:F-box domain-containing protein n=1 Tax=Rhodofomes roseus TaxID=34475 RepID=A0A4Y9YEU9_9APHY|nr:hypothetical protein EVJ58_g4732 [Rhodofomes roseus]
MSTPSTIRSMAIQSSPLCTLPLELLVEVALQVALLRTPAGPPSDIVSLLLSCKEIHDSLSFAHCATLYARIYQSNFDIRAPRRRMDSDDLHAQNYAAQLRKCCIALKRLRRGDLESEFLQDDLWTAWLMALENDGKNGEQLDWAGLDDVLRRFILEKLWEVHEPDDWPQESAVNALAIWLFWYRLSSDKLYALSNEQRSAILELVRPYALIAPRALLTERQKVPTPHGFWPLYRIPEDHSVKHYGNQLYITEPLLALGAQLLFFTLYWQPLIIPPNMPANRADAESRGRTGVGETRADLEEYNASSPVKLLEKGDWDWDRDLSVEEREREDAPRWRRGMRSPSARPMFVATYEFGTLTGLWKGLHLSPHPEQYFAAVRSVNFPADFSAENPHVFMHPVYLQLREHHSISPARRAPCGGKPNDNDDGINHAWLPSSHELREANGIVRLRDLQRLSEPAAVYETYVEGRKNSHDPETCNVCVAKQKAADAILTAKVERHQKKASGGASPSRKSRVHSPGADGERELENTRSSISAVLGQDVDNLLGDVLREDSPSSSEDDDYEGEYTIGREVTCVGVQDIIITGETRPHHGDAWYHFQCYGRIRQWDGLVALVRVPQRPPGHFGVYIFRGYIVGGRNFVGSWRVRTANTLAIPLEGPFIMSRVE